jgi:hypothetical protein
MAWKSAPCVVMGTPQGFRLTYGNIPGCARDAFFGGLNSVQQDASVSLASEQCANFL